jgi:hypothetical protein
MRCAGTVGGGVDVVNIPSSQQEVFFMMSFSVPNALTFLAVLSPFLILSLVIVLSGGLKS